MGPGVGDRPGHRRDPGVGGRPGDAPAVPAGLTRRCGRAVERAGDRDGGSGAPATVSLSAARTGGSGRGGGTCEGCGQSALASSLVLALGIVIGPASAETEADKEKVDAAAAEAGDDLKAANAQVDKAIADLKEVRSLLPAARTELAERTRGGDRRRGGRPGGAGRARPGHGRRDPRRAGARRGRVPDPGPPEPGGQPRPRGLPERGVRRLRPADHGVVGLRAGRPRRRRSTRCRGPTTGRSAQMAEVRAELALKEARLEVLRQQVDEKRQQAAIALSKANIARDQAAAAKLKVDLLVAQKAAGAGCGRLRAGGGPQAVQVGAGRAAAHRGAAGHAGRRRGGPPRRWWLAELRTHGRGRLPVAPRGDPHRAGRGPANPPGVRLPLLPHGRRPGRPHGHADPRSCRRHRRDQRHRWPVRQPHADLARQRDLLDVRPPVAVRRRGGGDREAGRRHRLRRAAPGYSTGPHLHFEIHVGSVPYDPLGWFGGPKEPVRC